MIAYLLDAGILLLPCDKEFDCYNVVYDHKYGYYDECQSYHKTKKEAVKLAFEYVKNGVTNTYAVVSETTLPDDFDFTDYIIENEDHTAKAVVYSARKDTDCIIENFIANEADMKAYLIEQGVWEQEVNELLNAFTNKVTKDDLRIVTIFDSAYDLAYSYIENVIGDLDHHVCAVLSYDKLGRHIAETCDEYERLGDGRIVQFEL